MPTFRSDAGKCVWPGCRKRRQFNFWCYSHWPALGEELQLRFLHAGSDREKVLEDCRQHAIATMTWLRTHVTGGQNVDTDAKAG